MNPEQETPDAGPQLLHMRLSALKNDVDKVRKVVDKALEGTKRIQGITYRLDPENENGLHVLLDRLDSISAMVARIIMKDPKIRLLIARHAEDLPHALEKLLPEYVTQMVIHTDAIKENIDSISAEVVNLSTYQQQSLIDNIEAGCSGLYARIAAIQRELDSSSEDPGIYRKLWAEFDGKLSEDAQKLFADYVDFIGGLAVRGNALDDQVCTMTDRLLNEIAPVSLQNVVVPARQTALGQVMQSVIKMGFPEWTIWGIPLVGHEVGLKVARAERDRGDENEIKKLFAGKDDYGMTQGRRMNLFADIFAAYTLGPSYANAVIKLRLAPHHVPPGQNDEEPPDADRVHLILRVLHLLHEQGNLNLDDEYKGTVKNLEKIWDSEARSLALGDTGNAAKLNNFLDSAWHALYEPKRFLAFDYLQWDMAQELQSYLLDGQTKPQPLPRVIALLAAAWEARTGNPAKTETIEERAKVLVMEPRGAGRTWPSGGPGGQAGGQTLLKEAPKP